MRGVHEEGELADGVVHAGLLHAHGPASALRRIGVVRDEAPKVDLASSERQKFSIETSNEFLIPKVFG